VVGATTRVAPQIKLATTGRVRVDGALTATANLVFAHMAPARGVIVATASAWVVVANLALVLEEAAATTANVTELLQQFQWAGR